MSKKRIIGVVVAAVILLLGTGAGLLAYFLTKDSPDQSSGGPYKRVAVVTDTPRCSVIGKNILNANGSAVDAAITAMFCLGVVSMHSSGIGGGGVMLVYNQTSKQVKVIDFRETAPATAHKNMFKGNESKARKGGLAIAVPGEVRGMHKAWKRHGRLPWKQLVQPAIDLARKGFKVTQAVEDALKTTKGIKDDIENDPGLSELLLTKNKKLVKKGDVIKNVQYAETLETVRDNPDSFYNGTLASKILRDIKEVNGNLTEEDLRSYTWILRDPYQSNIRDMKMYLTPPPTSGAVLALILNILRGYNMTSSARDDVNATVLTYHRIIESFKFSYAWRSRLGDPKFDQTISKVGGISSMCPTILTDNDGKVRFIIGASGGKRITTAVSLVLMNKLWFGDDLSKAVDEPRLHSQLVPDQTVFYEKHKPYRVQESVIEGLRERGHIVNGSDLFAVVQAIYKEPGARIFAKADPRKHGAPAGE
ncbi:glutathione hydrolase 1 proenzyme-like [Pocillopora damicornis]|uniref:glutathione hydrolase 1 proenzyme-like n=1 Tax=Pocillopora damicornis TaxID=46731 RepID=UPI000F54EBA9|nr:glutathione hydrolase 1 proenzyme-like [Pocillopora damicornis]